MPVRVSIIIPCYNHSGYVREAVDSVLAQSCRDFEIVLVDDGSTDGTEKVFTEIKAANPDRVAIVRQENKGLSLARQAGLECASGEFVVFLDADDRLMPGMLESCLNRFHNAPDAAAIVGKTKVVHEDARMEPRILSPGANDRWPEVLAVNPFGAICSIMFRKKALVAAGGVGLPGVRACEDWDLYARMLRRGMRFARVAEALAVYAQHENALSRDLELMLREKIALLDRMVRDVAGPARLTREAYGRYRNGHVLFAIGEAAGKNNINDIERIASHMIPGEIDFRYFCNQFLYGMQHSVALTRRKFDEDDIERVCGAVARRFSEIGFGAYAKMAAREFRREMKNPLRRRSIARRLSRTIDPLRKFLK